MINAQNAGQPNIFQWVTASAGLIKGQLAKSSSGAVAVAAGHTGQTLLGLALETTASGEPAILYPLFGTVLVITVLQTGTKKTFTDANLGTQYDLVVGAGGDMSLDPDDTSGGFLILVGYNNADQKAYVVVDPQDILVSI